MVLCLSSLLGKGNSSNGGKPNETKSDTKQRKRLFAKKAADFFTLTRYVALSHFIGHRVRFLLPLAVLVLLDVSRKGLHLPAVVVVEEIVSNFFLLERRRQLDVGSAPELRARLPCVTKGSRNPHAPFHFYYVVQVKKQELPPIPESST